MLITQALGKPRKVDCGEAKFNLSYRMRLSQKGCEDGTYSVWSGDFQGNSLISELFAAQT